MPLRFSCFILLCFVPLLAYPAKAQPPNIDMANHDLKLLKTWANLDHWRRHYAPKYDHGFYAEGISHFVERKLAHHWTSFTKLASLAKRTPGLFAFTLNHLGNITDCADTKTIVANAIRRCPAGLKDDCHRLVQALAPHAAPRCLPKVYLDQANTRSSHTQ